MDARAADVIALRAWPARLTEQRNGWFYRFNDGYTDRANSTAVIDAGADLTASVEWARRRARRDSTTLQFQVSDRPELQAVIDQLNDDGFSERSPTSVMVGLVEPGPDTAVELSSGAKGTWFDDWWSLTGGHVAGREVVERFFAELPESTLVGRIWDGREAVSVGVGIDVDGVTYVCSMFTAPSHRGRGLASRLIGAFAAANGPQLVLQVAEDNTSARSVYERLGLQVIGRYCYFVEHAQGS